MLTFSQRSLDEWKGNGGEQSVDDPRMLDLSDAIATPGLVDAKTGGGASDCLEFKFGGASIKIKNGEIILTASTITLVGDFALDGDMEVDGTIRATGDIDGNV
jgi:hypothetical protein